MKRRDFIKLSSLSLIPILSCKQEYGSWEESNFDISIHSDMSSGHLIMQSENFEVSEQLETKLLVVGAGIAGLTAAANAPGKDCIVCELSDRIGGSSGSETYKGAHFCQGAHYDLVYPNYFGEESLGFFENLDILKYNKQAALWEYTDKQYLIKTDYESQCFSAGKFRDDVLPEGEVVQNFLDFMDAQLGNYMLPTRSIPEKIRHLNNQTFLDYLKENIEITPELTRAIDYQMIDDFSGETHEVSALAGMYYYANRPYRTAEIEIFSPPEGNFYFANKIASTLSEDQILTSHLVKNINQTNDGFEVDVVDINNKKIKKIKAANIIYAGQKHALKYILPDQYPLFESNQYAPWMVVNFVLKENKLDKGYWQNEVLLQDKSFLGFVDSNAQYSTGKPRVLSAYYCFPSWQRKNLANIEKTAQQLVSQTAENIGWYFGLRPEQFSPIVEKVFIKVMGHAMPIPVPGYLFNDKNQNRKYKNLAFAGVDNSRLPLLLEAVDSGICAVNEIFPNKV